MELNKSQNYHILAYNGIKQSLNFFITVNRYYYTYTENIKDYKLFKLERLDPFSLRYLPVGRKRSLSALLVVFKCIFVALR